MKLLRQVIEDATPRFKLQQRWLNGEWFDGEWQDLAAELYTQDEAQAFLDDSPADEADVEERAISTDRKTILKPNRKKQSAGKNVLARHATADVHRRNSDFFNQYL